METFRRRAFNRCAGPSIRGHQCVDSRPAFRASEPAEGTPESGEVVRVPMKSPTLRTLIVFAASIPLVALPLFGLWVHRFLKDYRTGVYAIAFVVALAIAMQIPGLRLARGQAGLASSAWRGAIVGYLAGLVAYVVLALIIPDGASKVTARRAPSSRSGSRGA